MNFDAARRGGAVRRSPRACSAALLFVLPLAGQIADTVYENAIIHTADPSRPRATAMAIRGDRILAVGEDVSAYLDERTRHIDVKGATIVPGFIDSHGHLAGLGQSLRMVDLRAARSEQDAAMRVAQAARGRAAGEWILGRGWDQTFWDGSGFPTLQSLDKLVPDHPVYLTRVDGHAAWVNSKALAAADLNAATKDPPGGRILRDSLGRPAGVLIDRAQNLVSRRIPPLPASELESLLERASRECVRLGLTTVHDAGVGSSELSAYRSLIAKDKLPLRVYAMIHGEGELWNEYLNKGPEVSDRLTVRSIKLMADGALGSRGAALQKPYSDEPANSGLLILTRADIERVAGAALQAGLQVNTHAIGDRANRAVLEAYAAVLGGENDRRFRIEHAQVVSPADFDLFAKYSLIASMQATHATSDMRWAEQRLGAARLSGAYAWKKLLDRDVVVANGSDFPVESPDPLLGSYASVTRQDRGGKPAGGWLAAEKMSREEALRSWTWAGAYAAFEETRKGTLAPAKLADFVVLSRDIMTIPAAEIPSVRVKRTVVGGVTVWTEQFHAAVPLVRGRSKYIELPPIDNTLTIVCRYGVLRGRTSLRAVVMSKEDMGRYQQGGGARWLASSGFGAEGELRARISRPGSYVVVLDNGSGGDGEAEALLDVGLEFDARQPSGPRMLPTARRFIVAGVSLGFLAMIGAWSGWRVRNAFRRRDTLA
jgi:predicted amidohydrolase YtcJ